MNNKECFYLKNLTPLWRRSPDLCQFVTSLLLVGVLANNIFQPIGKACEKKQCWRDGNISKGHRRRICSTGIRRITRLTNYHTREDSRIVFYEYTSVILIAAISFLILFCLNVFSCRLYFRSCADAAHGLCRLTVPQSPFHLLYCFAVATNYCI